MYGEVVLETLFVFYSTFLEMEDIYVAQCAAMRNGQEALHERGSVRGRLDDAMVDLGKTSS
jgi:hypothetical protein